MTALAASATSDSTTSNSTTTNSTTAGSTTSGDRPTPRARLDSLTGLRWVAALAVWFAHTAVLFEGTRVFSPWERMAGHGAVWVSFFFCLSGFVLTWSSRPNDKTGGYYRRRFARIYPAYFVATLAGLAVVAAEGAFNARTHGWSFGLEALLLQSWTRNPGSVNFVGWSLSCEAFFYLMFPFTIGWFRARTPRTHGWLLALTLALIIGLQVLALNGPVPDRAVWIIDHAPPVRMLEFVAGILIALLALDGHFPRLRLGWCLALTAGAYAIARILTEDAPPIAIMIVPFALLLAVAARTDLAQDRSWLRRPTMRRLGEWSFAFYLVHQLVIRGIVVVAPEQRSLATAIGLVIVGLAVSIAASAALYHVVERPLERRLRGRREAPSPVAFASDTAPAPAA